MADWRFHIRSGLDLDFSGVPAWPAGSSQGPLPRQQTARAARTGLDDIGVKPDLAVEPGRRVQAGDVLWRDRQSPAIRFTAPATGTVTAVNRGHKRKLVSVVIEREDGDGRTFSGPSSMTPEAVRPWLLETGLWTVLKTRPFGRIPDPKSQPLAVFVTAMEADPLAPDPANVIALYTDAFAEGLRLLMGGVENAPVIVCAAPGAELRALPGSVRRADFSGSHASALPGTHIHRLCPVGWHGAGPGLDGHVWQVGYQDVIAIGHAALSGRLWQERVVTLGGPLIAIPKTVLAPLGACVSALVADNLVPGPLRLIAGTALSGRAAFGAQDYLSPAHHQVTALQENAPAKDGGTAMGGHPGSILPVPDVERAWPFDSPATPLMRALAVGDGEAVRALGGLALLEEDVAALSFACPSKTEYGVLLREVLDDVFKAEGFGVFSPGEDAP